VKDKFLCICWPFHSFGLHFIF